MPPGRSTGARNVNGSGQTVQGRPASAAGGRTGTEVRKEEPQRAPAAGAIGPGGSIAQRIDIPGHRVIRERRNIDYFLLIVILLLVTIGIAAVASASYPQNYVRTGDGLSQFRSHLRYAIAGVAFMIFVAVLIDPVVIKKFAVPAFILAQILLWLVLLTPLGKVINGARRWLEIGPVSFQPSELMKFALPLLLAWYFDLGKSKRWGKLAPLSESDLTNPVYFFYIPLVFIGLALLPVVLQPHLSGTVIIAVIGWTVILFNRPNWRLFPLLPLAGVAFMIYTMIKPYAKSRLEGNHEQTMNSVTAIGSGGLFGVGYGHSRMKYSYITEAENDFIFSIWCEEMGFIGAIIVVLLFALFVWRGYEIARRAPDRFTSLLAYGIVTQVGVQALLNFLVVSDFFWNTGISLPFISYGGTALLVLLGEMGVLLSISRHTYHKEKLTTAPQRRDRV